MNNKLSKAIKLTIGTRYRDSDGEIYKITEIDSDFEHVKLIRKDGNIISRNFKQLSEWFEEVPYLNNK